MNCVASCVSRICNVNLCKPKMRQVMCDNYKRVIATPQPMVMPINILERNLNKRMSLLLKDGRALEGKLIGFDEYMNMVLEDTTETKDDVVKKMGKVILRGNNVVTIAPL